MSRQTLLARVRALEERAQNEPIVCRLADGSVRLIKSSGEHFLRLLYYRSRLRNAELEGKESPLRDETLDQQLGWLREAVSVCGKGAEPFLACFLQDNHNRREG